jgi:thiol-disulfide isomerase/thioredoxin
MTTSHPPSFATTATAPHDRRRFMGGTLAVGLAGTAGLLGLAGCSGGDPAPPSTFVLLDGSQVRTADLKGKVTLVNFWATTCVSCVRPWPWP